MKYIKLNGIRLTKNDLGYYLHRHSSLSYYESLPYGLYPEIFSYEELAQLFKQYCNVNSLNN